MSKRQNLIKSDYSVTWIEDGIVNQVISSKIESVNLEIAKGLFNDLLAVHSNVGIKFLVLIDLNKVRNIEMDAKYFYRRSDTCQTTVAAALLMDNYITRLVTAICVDKRKSVYPVELFNSKTDAIKWLNDQRIFELN